MNEPQPPMPTVPELLFSAAASLVQLGGKALAEDGDADNGRKAIEGIRALVPLLAEEEQKALQEPLTQLQMLWVKATKAEPDPDPEADQKARAAQQRARDEEERAKARAKIWTPGS